ncbi:MAG: KEOPS complex subunit Cgi121 [Methanocorpusculum sp.]|nr:KEOPS complex subunit Cgi121 [Methanocorpusculum sp.]
MEIFSGKINAENVSKTLSEVNRIGEKTNSVIVLFDAEKTAGAEHIRSAGTHAKRAFDEKRNIARSLAMEILVYASGQRQCSLATRFGLHVGENSVYVLILDGDEASAKADILKFVTESSVNFPSAETLKAEFQITDEELAVIGEDRIVELVLERVALVDVWK